MPRVSRRRFRRLIKVGSVVVLLLAVAPQVLYLGHPSVGSDSATQAVPAGHEQHAQTATKHANHCHIAPKGCSSADGTTQVASLSEAIQVSSEDRSFGSNESSQLLRSFILWQRPEKPPQPV